MVRETLSTTHQLLILTISQQFRLTHSSFGSLTAVSAHSQLLTCGEDVGLPDGQMGNSEVGHLNIGAGRIVY